MIGHVPVLSLIIVLYVKTSYCKVFVNSVNDLEGSLCYQANGAYGTCRRFCRDPDAIWEEYGPNVCNTGQFPMLYCCVDTLVKELFPEIYEVCMTRKLVASIEANKRRGNSKFMETIDSCDGIETNLQRNYEMYFIKHCYHVRRQSMLALSIPNGVIHLNDPSIAVVGHDNGNGRVHWICIGHFIHKAFVLTSGNCVRNQKAQPNIVKYGQINSNDTESTTYDQNAVTYVITRHHFNPNYSSESLTHETVLLQVRRNTTGELRPIPACLWTKSEIPGKNLSLLGYSHTWQEGNVTPTSLTDCANKMSVENLNGTLASCYVCNFSDKGPITASLHYSENLEVDVPYLVAMGSCGMPCNGNEPAYFSYIYPQLAWIESTFSSYRFRTN